MQLKYTLDVKDFTVDTEVFSARDKDILDLVSKCRKLTRNQFKDAVQPGDVIIPYKRQKYANLSLRDKVVTAINKVLQGSSFTSCKMIGPTGKTVVGFGVIAGKENITQAGIDKFFSMHEAALIMRYKNITSEQQQRVVENMMTAMKDQIPYDKVNLVWSVAHHWFGTFNKDVKDQDFNNTQQKTLICSSLVYKCFHDAGLKIDHDKSVGDKWIWPKEYLTSKSFYCVGGYFSKESGVK